jgi:hypothetical protein
MLTAFALIAAPASAADYASAVAAANPIANFQLTAPGTPSTVGGYSTSYSATTGTGPGAPIAAYPGNTGATFTGNNGAPSEVATGLSGLIPGKGSINLWVNLAALPSTLGQYFYLAGESQVGNDFDMQIQNDNRLYIYTGGGENTSYALDTASLVGQWHMLTASYDGTLGANSFRDLYVDGVEVADFTGGLNSAAKSSQFTIGYSNVFGGRDTDGTIDEVSVFDYGLSASQVSAIYQSAAVPAAVPEPASWAMMIGGFGMIGGALRRRAKVAFG